LDFIGFYVFYLAFCENQDFGADFFTA